MSGATKPRSGVAERRRAFVQAYIANGHNATRAAIVAGYSPKTARSQGQRLLTNVAVSRELVSAARDVASLAGLETERTVQEVARLSYFDPLGLYGPDGQLLPLAQMPVEARACISSIDFDKDTGRVVRIRFWDKNAALEKAMRHLGLFEKGNRQQGQNLAIQVNLVGAPAPREVQAKTVP
jgi:phage terminase small subunit